MRRLHFISLGVKDLELSKKFYCSLFDWKPASLSSEHIVFYNMGGYALTLFPWDHLAQDAQTTPESHGFRGFTLAHNVHAKEEVAAFLKKAETKGGTIVKPAQDVFWGGHSGYFSDPNGHLWEVAFNPFTGLDADGFLELED